MNNSIEGKMKTLTTNLFFLISILIIDWSYPQAQLIQSFTEKNITGNSSFGSAVASAGDLNGDGFADMIVAAPDFGESGRFGRVYIYFGSTNFDTTADVSLISNVTGRNLGVSVSSAGDFNNDGYDDVIVGSKSGKAFLYYGGEVMDNVADLTFQGETGDTRFSYKVSCAGDMNNDGYTDVMIACYYNLDSQGKVYIYLGNNSGNNSPDIILDEFKQSYGNGISISSAGDLNNDGFDDIIIGSDAQQDTGMAYIFKGDTIPDDEPDLILKENGTSLLYGYDVSSAGDVNNDGFDDFLVNVAGAYYTQLFLGAAVLDSIPDKLIYCDSTSYNNGLEISSAGDLNNDGYDDFIIGNEKSLIQKWYASIYYGSENIDSLESYQIVGNSYSLYIDQCISKAGDINNDGFDDIMIGIGGFKNLSGVAYIYLGSINYTTIPDYALIGESKYNYFSSTASNSGDINNDGFDDIILNAGGYNQGTGAVYFYLGSEQVDSVADIILFGADSSFLGGPICFADVNNDGYDDFILSGKNFDKLLYFGGEQIDTIPDLIFNNGSGLINCAGDLNNDGFDDLVFGQPGFSMTRGRIYVYFGGTSMDTIPDLSTTPPQNSYHDFGCSVSTAGDVNNDGYDDLIVGAQAYNSYKGRAFIFFGGVQMDTLADIVLDPIVTSTMFGSVVSNAGDVNSDGFDDVLVSAIGYNNFNGNVYLYYGGVQMDTNPDLEFNQGGYDWSWGLSVSSAGDINNDLFDDIMIAGSTYCPVIRIYYGGSNMDNTADIIVQDQGIYDHATEISKAGDVNNDGYDDILIGNSRYENNGRVWLYTDPGAPLSIENPGTGTNLVREFYLEQNYPNPFNPVTIIQFAINKREFVTLKIYDVLGGEIETIVNEYLEAGVHSKLYIANSTLASGVYFYRLQVADPEINSGQGFVATKKMLMIK